MKHKYLGSKLITGMLVFIMLIFGMNNRVKAAQSVTDTNSLKQAITNNEANIIIANDFEVTETISIPASYTGTIKAEGTAKTLSLANNKVNMFKIEGKVNFENVNLDGKKQGRLLQITNSANVVYKNGTINNGRSWIEGVSTNSDYSDGGAIYLSGSSLTLDNAKLLDNEAIRPANPPRSDMNGHGGALYAFGAKELKVINNSEIIRNVSGLSSVGGAFYVENTELFTMSDSSVGSNHTHHVGTDGNQGGAFYITNTKFVDSKNAYDVGKTFNVGGAIFFMNIPENKKATITDSKFHITNLGDQYGISGGAIGQLNAHVEISKTEFKSIGTSKVIHAGGVIDVVGGGSLTLKNSTIESIGASATAATFGGAIAFETGSTATGLIEKTSIKNYSADQTGGAIALSTRYNESAKVNLTLKDVIIENTSTWNNTNFAFKAVGGAIFVGNGNTLTVDGGSISKSTSNYGGSIYNKGNTTITGGAKLLEGSAKVLGSGIYNDGYLKLDEMTLDSKENPNYPATPDEYSGTGVYAVKDVIVTPKANIAANDDIRVLDKKSKILLTGPLAKNIYVSISEEKKAINNTSVAGSDTESNIERYIGYLVSTGTDNYKPTVEDAKKLHYYSKPGANAQPVAEIDDHTLIGKWDLVLTPTNEVVVGQRAKAIYHSNGDNSKFDDTKTEKEQVYTFYSSTNAWSTPKQMTKIDDKPTREGYRYVDWYKIADVKDLKQNEINNNKFDFENEKFTSSAAPITKILSPNVINIYAGWVREFKVIHKFKAENPADTLPDAINKLTSEGGQLPVNRSGINGEEVKPSTLLQNVVVVNGVKWEFISWDKEKDTINQADVTFTGTWRRYYKVDHEFVSEDPAKQLPAEIMNRLPASKTDILNGTLVKPGDFDKADVVEGDGKWKFKAWDKQSTTINFKDEKFVGTWVYVPNVYKVVHKFVNKDATVGLPQAIKNRLPANQEGKLTGTVVKPSDFDKSELVDGDGKWVFNAWDKEEDTINRKDVEFVGTWEYIPNVYKVTHEFVSEDPTKELPQEIKDRLPANQEGKLTGTVVKPSDIDKAHVVEGDGHWEFKAWDKEEATINRKDEKFVGTWVYIPNVYKVVHEFVSEDPTKELPQEIKDRLPANQENLVTGTPVKPSNFDKSDVADSEGKWQFKSWDKEDATIDLKDEKFVGTWVYVKNIVINENKPNKSKKVVETSDNNDIITNVALGLMALLIFGYISKFNIVKE